MVKSTVLMLKEKKIMGVSNKQCGWERILGAFNTPPVPGI